LLKEALEEGQQKVQDEEGAAAATAGPGGDDKDTEKKKPYKIDDDNADPSLPVGHRRPNERTPVFQTKSEVSKIGDRNYTAHALDEMRAQGITPSVVEETIRSGTKFPGNRPATTVNYDPANNISEEQVVTVSFGRLAGGY
jgi:hypothetical protein